MTTSTQLPKFRVRHHAALVNAEGGTKSTSRGADGKAQDAKVASAAIIQQHQSLDIAQTLLHGSISCLSYLRNLFSERCFDDQTYYTTDRHCTYEDYVKGGAHSESQVQKGSLRDVQQPTAKLQGTTIKVLQRGRSRVVDNFLDLLEHGAFEALKLNVLRAIRLNIFEDPKNPSNVVEAYTFTFRYVRSSETGTSLGAFDMQGPGGNTVTVKTARHALQMFIRRLIALCNTLPDLPESRFLTVHLFYVDECDPDYEPPGFDPCLDNRIYFPNSDGWTKQVQSCGTLNAGFHAVDLRVSHLQFLAAGGGGERNHDSSSIIPAGRLKYAPAPSVEDDVDVLMTEAEPNQEADQKGAAEAESKFSKMSFANSTYTKANGSAWEGSDSHSESTEAMDPRDVSANVPAVHFTRDETEAKRAAQGAMRGLVASESKSDSIRNAGQIITREQQLGPQQIAAMAVEMVEDSQTTTQRMKDLQIGEQLLRILEPSSQVQSLEPTQIENSATESLRQSHDDKSRTPAFQFSQKKLAELNALKKRRDGTNQRSVEPGGSLDSLAERIERKDVIDCQCGSNGEEDDMIQCSFCDRWQHLCCYGYRGSDDPRIPSVHVCYACLLQEKEAPLLRELKDFALVRKGLHILQLAGFHNDKAFSEALQCDLQTASRLATHLRNEGFLVPTAGSKKKGFFRTGKPKYMIVGSGDAHSEMMKKYFDPSTKIAHHFELPQPQLSDSTLPVKMNATLSESERHRLHVPSGSSHDRQAPIKDSYDPRLNQGGSLSSMHIIEATSDARTGKITTKQTDLARYPLRHSRGASYKDSPSNTKPIGKSATLLPGTPPRKRGHEEDKTAEGGRSSRKRMKSSKSQVYINIGNTFTPSPVHRGVV